MRFRSILAQFLLPSLVLTGVGTAHAAPPPCPVSMAVVDRTVPNALIYLPADPANPWLCPMVRPGGAVVGSWFSLWDADWPGAERAGPAIRRVWEGPPGTTERFNTTEVGPWHETWRHEGLESLTMAGAVRPTMKLSHEREGFGGNTYHSVKTFWIEIATGLTIYQEYRHIAGQPIPGMRWSALTIVGGR